MLVLCVGMKRSGSTLQYNLARSLVESTDSLEGGYILSMAPEQRSKLFHEYATDSKLCVVKSHTMPAEAAALPADQVRFCYIYRDIRDVAVSIRAKEGLTGEKLLAYLDTCIDDYHEIMRANPVLKQKYEDVMADTPAAIRELADFLAVPVDDQLVQQINEQYSIETALSKQKPSLRSAVRSILVPLSRAVGGKDGLRKWGAPRWLLRHVHMPRAKIDSRTELHADHISKDKGACGLWRTSLPKKDIEVISRRYADWLTEVGYPPGPVDSDS